MNFKKFYEYVLKVTGLESIDDIPEFVAGHLDELATSVGCYFVSKALFKGKEGDTRTSESMKIIADNKQMVDDEWKHFIDWHEYRKTINKGNKDGKNLERD